MTNKTNTNNLIALMILSKYHESTFSTVLKVHKDANNYGLPTLHNHLDNLVDYSLKRQKSCTQATRFYAKYNGSKGYRLFDTRWYAYDTLTHIFLNYIDMYCLKYKGDKEKTLSYKIITNTL